MATTKYIQGCTAPLDVKDAMEQLRSDCLTNGTNASAVQTDLNAVEASVIVDLTTLRSAMIVLATALDTLATKLNADAGVTDTNYATTNAATMGTPAITTA